MKLAKSLLLASAAGFAAFGAQAADLPSKKAAPVEYVKVCKTYGAGFFTIPGTDTCLRIGAQLRADTVFTERFEQLGARAAKAEFDYRMRVRMDARQQTSFGLLRAYTQIAIGDGNGLSGQGATLGSSGVSDDTTDHYAFIQWGGLTVGKADSFFAYAPGTAVFSALGRVAPQVMVAAYTFGDSKANLTIAAQEPQNNNMAANTSGNATTYFNIPQQPDFVVRGNYNFGPGTVYASGALHQVNPVNAVDIKYGWAAAAGFQFRDFAGKGSTFDLIGAYSEGAIGYIGGGSVANNIYDNYANSATNASTGFDMGSAATAGTKLNTAWNVNGLVVVPVTPTVSLLALGGYLDFNDRTGTLDFERYTIGAGAVWTAAAGLTIRPEVQYSQLKIKGSTSGDYTRGIIRVQRDF